MLQSGSRPNVNSLLSATGNSSVAVGFPPLMRRMTIRSFIHPSLRCENTDNCPRILVGKTKSVNESGTILLAQVYTEPPNGRRIFWGLPNASAATILRLKTAAWCRRLNPTKFDEKRFISGSLFSWLLHSRAGCSLPGWHRKRFNPAHDSSGDPGSVNTAGVDGVVRKNPARRGRAAQRRALAAPRSRTRTKYGRISTPATKTCRRGPRISTPATKTCRRGPRISTPATKTCRRGPRILATTRGGGAGFPHFVVARRSSNSFEFTPHS